MLSELGYTIIIATIAPLSSNWERACELYAQLTEGKYGHTAALFGLLLSTAQDSVQLTKIPESLLNASIWMSSTAPFLTTTRANLHTLKLVAGDAVFCFLPMARSTWSGNGTTNIQHILSATLKVAIQFAS